MRKKIKSVILVFTFIILFTGCGKKDGEAIKPIETANVTKESNTPKPAKIETTLTPEELHEGQARSKISNIWIDEELVTKRPYALMFNNIQYASPQSGISQASILYEAVVEGGITRLMGIFEEFDSNRIGSARSARHYFVSFADEYDAIFVHYGQTKYALSKMATLGTDNLSGLEGVGSTVFYRDKSLKAPHNAFASYEGIIKGTKQKGYRTELKEDYENHFTFYEEDTSIQGKKAEKITLGFSRNMSPYFEYNKKNKKYYRFQFGGKHTDKNTGKQLAFKNIIIQCVKEWNIDKNGYQTMEIENSSGKGYYITNGHAEEITWKKNESTKKMHYYDAEGNVLCVNSGKTYIGIFPDNRLDYLKIQ